MRILSKFKDYYDGVQAHGVDDDLIYMRQTKELSLPAHPEFNKHWPTFIGEAGWRGPFNASVEYQRYSIGFCGVIRPLFHLLVTLDLKHCPHSGELLERVTDECWAYEPEEMIEFLDRHDGWRIGGYRRSAMTRDERAEQVREYFRVNAKYRDDSLFAQHRVPLWYIGNTPGKAEYDRPTYTWSRHRNVVLNPCLNELKFFTQVDPFLAYQEIRLYMGGVLGFPGPVMETISDESMIQKKGFDEQSFRAHGKKRKAHKKKAKAKLRKQRKKDANS